MLKKPIKLIATTAQREAIPRSLMYAGKCAVMNASCYRYPGASRLLPRAWRAVQSFEKLSITAPGGP